MGEKRPITITSSHFALTLIFFQIILLLFFWRKLPPQVPLLYSRPWGEEQLVSTAGLFLLPFVSTAVLTANHFITLFLLREEELMKKIFNVTSAAFSLINFIALVQIIRLVI